MPTLPALIDEPTRHPGCCLSLSRPLLATIRDRLVHAPRLVLKNHPNGDGCDWGPESLILSIGSGTGLLEELLHVYLNHDVPTPSNPKGPGGNWVVEGVEVDPAVNTYLPEDRINHVRGTWTVLETRAREAVALMFVYPRHGALVRRYIDAYMGSSQEARDTQKCGAYSDGEGQDDGKRENKNTKGRVQDHCPDEDTRHGRSISCDGRQLVLWLGPKCDWKDTGLESFQADDEFEVMELSHGIGLAEYEMLATLRRKAPFK